MSCLNERTPGSISLAFSFSVRVMQALIMRHQEEERVFFLHLASGLPLHVISRTGCRCSYSSFNVHGGRERSGRTGATSKVSSVRTKGLRANFQRRFSQIGLPNENKWPYSLTTFALGRELIFSQGLHILISLLSIFSLSHRYTSHSVIAMQKIEKKEPWGTA